jgi:hypothetical protein
MPSILRFELKRAFCNRLYALALIIPLLIVVSHIVFHVMPVSLDESDLLIAKGGYPYSLFNTWLGGRGDILQTTLYFTLLPLFVCIPFADTLFSDRKGGYTKNIVTRVPLRDYYCAKAVAIFLTAATVATLPLIIDILLTALFVPAVIPLTVAGTFPIFESSMWSALYYSHPFAYLSCYLLLISIFSGLLANLALFFTYLVDNRFLVALAPFIVCIFADFMLNVLGGQLFRFSPILFLRPDQPAMASFGIILAEAVALAIALSVFLIVRTKRDETY